MILCLVAWSAQGAGRITLVSDPWPPYIEGSLDQPPSGGVAINLFNQLFSQLPHWQVDYLLMPWKRCLAEVEVGHKDGVMLVFKTPEREKEMVFSESLFEGKALLWQRADRPGGHFEWSDWSDLEGTSVGVVTGYSLGSTPLQKAIQQGLKIQLVEASSDRQLLQMLSLARMDFAVLDAVSARLLLAELGLNAQIVASRKPIDRYEFHIGFSRHSRFVESLGELDRAIQEMKMRGEIESIIYPR